MLKAGIKGTAKTIVKETNTARAMKSGDLPVFATPSMAALMEEAAANSILPHLDEGCSTVGTLMNIKHTSATPVGAAVRTESELTAVNGRRLVFHVSAFDEEGLIGEGEHERFIIRTETFMERTNAKLCTS